MLLNALWFRVYLFANLLFRVIHNLIVVPDRSIATGDVLKPCTSSLQLQFPRCNQRQWQISFSFRQRDGKRRRRRRKKNSHVSRYPTFSLRSIDSRDCSKCRATHFFPYPFPALMQWHRVQVFFFSSDKSHICAIPSSQQLWSTFNTKWLKSFAISISIPYASRLCSCVKSFLMCTDYAN